MLARIVTSFGDPVGSVPNTVATGEAIKLLTPKVGDGDGIINLRNSLQIAGHVSIHQSKGAQNRWLLPQTPQALSEHKERMVTADVVRSSILYQPTPQSVRFARRTMMNKMQVSKASRAPAKRVGLYLVHGVPARRRPEATDAIPTCLTIDLCSPANMKCGGLFHLLDAIGDVADHASANTKFRISIKLFEAALEIVRVEGKITVKFGHELPVAAGNCPIPVIKRIYNPAP